MPWKAYSATVERLSKKQRGRIQQKRKPRKRR